MSWIGSNVFIVEVDFEYESLILFWDCVVDIRLVDEDVVDFFRVSLDLDDACVLDKRSIFVDTQYREPLPVHCS